MQAWRVLYTKQLQKKKKTYQDGFAVVRASGAVALLDEAGKELARAGGPLPAGEDWATCEGATVFEGFLVNGDGECPPCEVPGLAAGPAAAAGAAAIGDGAAPSHQQPASCARASWGTPASAAGAGVQRSGWGARAARPLLQPPQQKQQPAQAPLQQPMQQCTEQPLQPPLQQLRAAPPCDPAMQWQPGGRPGQATQPCGGTRAGVPRDGMRLHVVPTWRHAMLHVRRWGCMHVQTALTATCHEDMQNCCQGSSVPLPNACLECGPHTHRPSKPACPADDDILSMLCGGSAVGSTSGGGGGGGGGGAGGLGGGPGAAGGLGGGPGGSFGSSNTAACGPGAAAPSMAAAGSFSGLVSVATAGMSFPFLALHSVVCQPCCVQAGCLV